MRKFLFHTIFTYNFRAFFTITSCVDKERKALELKIDGINLIYKSRFDDALEH